MSLGKPHRKLLFSCSAVLFFVTTLLGNPAAHAQAKASASRSADISVFGGLTAASPDYGPHDWGFTLGADYTRYFGWRVAPAFEARVNRTSGNAVTEESMLFGPRLQADLRHFHPYATGLFGATKIIFKNPPYPRYTQDTAATLSFGGGVDIDVIKNFQLKIDYQGEFMNFGPNGTQPGNADFTLSPSLWTVGVVYHIPFRPRRR